MDATEETYEGRVLRVEGYLVIGTDAERAVIGSILLDPTTLPLLDGVVSGEDFSDAQLEILWHGIQGMRANRDVIDVITVGSKLGEWGVKVFSPAVLHQWVSDTPHAAGATGYGEVVHDAAMRRRIRLTAKVMLEKVDDVTPAELISAAVNDLRQNTQTNQLKARPLGDILAESTIHDWIIPGLLERRDRIIITGSEGAGKSTLIRQVAILACAGLHPFDHGPIDPVKVLVIDAENSETQWRRAAKGIASRAKQLGSHDPSDMALACIPRIDVTRDHDLAQVHRLVDDIQPDLVVIGPLYRLIGRAITNDDDAAPLLAALDTIRDRGIALMIEAHSGHALTQGGERDLRPRGSAALMGWPEFGLGLRLPKSGPAHELVRWRGDRDARSWPDAVEKGGDFPWQITWVEK